MIPLDVFGSGSVAATLLQRVHWRDGVPCSRCRSDRTVKNGSYRAFQRYLCKGCDRTFNDKTGTIFAHSKLALRREVYHKPGRDALKHAVRVTLSDQHVLPKSEHINTGNDRACHYVRQELIMQFNAVIAVVTITSIPLESQLLSWTSQGASSEIWLGFPGSAIRSCGPIRDPQCCPNLGVPLVTGILMAPWPRLRSN
jgi:hypothetical protein